MNGFSFTLKKFISAWLLPLPIMLLLCAVGIVLLWFTQHQLLGKILVTCGLAVILLFSNIKLAATLLNQLEHAYPPIMNPNQNIHWIVVLAGGHLEQKNVPATSQLYGVTLGRVVEAVRLAKLIPEAKVLFTGGPIGKRSSEGEMMAKGAITLGLDKSRVVLENQSIDTRTNASFAKQFVKDDQFYLVTSSWHMPRSMKLFTKLGMHPIPAPCDYHTPKNMYFGFQWWVPSFKALVMNNVIIHEYLGMLWSKIRRYS